jgi:hypothetical protein
MAERGRAGLRARRLVLLAVALSCAADAHQAFSSWPIAPGPRVSAAAAAPKHKSAARPRTHRKPAPQSQPTSQPAATSEPAAVPPAGETIAQARRRLARIPLAQRTPSDLALLAAIDFALAVAEPDGRRAASMVEVVGYQPLPLTGDLPEPPDKPIWCADVEKRIAARSPVKLTELKRERLEVHTRAKTKPLFPPIAAWMLAQDRVVVFQPSVDPPLPGWVTRPACIVVRLRAGRTTVMGGNLLEVLGESAATTATHSDPK